MSRNLIADLSNYSLQDLIILAKHNDINPNNVLAQELAPKIMTAHKAKDMQVKAHMVGSKDELPYGGDLSKARGAGDREAIREIVKWQREKQESLPKESEIIIEEAKDCSNDADYITQEKWTGKPDIKIHFLDPNDLDKKPYTVCLDKTSLVKWMRDTNNYHARWVSKDRKKGMDTMGHGGAPFLKQIYLRLPDGSSYVTNSPLRRGSDQIGIPLEKGVRVGGLTGSFGVGETHGQEPGYIIYQLIPSDEYTRENMVKIFMDYLSKNRETVFKIQDKNTQTHFIKAIRNNKLATVKRLLENPDVNPTINNNYAIRKASKKGYIDIVKLLLDDPRVDPTDNDNSAIISADIQGHHEIVDLLLEDKRVNKSLTEIINNNDVDDAFLFDILSVILNNATINNETPIVDYIKEAVKQFSQQGDYSLLFIKQDSEWSYAGIYDRQEFIDAMTDISMQEYILAPPFNPPTEQQETRPPSPLEIKDIIEQISKYSESYIDLAIHYWNNGVLLELLKEMLSNRIS